MKHQKRPYIPLKVRTAVALRQLRAGAPSRVRSEKNLLERLLAILAKQLNCARTDLHLDHNPALCLRERLRSGRYRPDANDPDHLEYRDKRPEAERSHYVKTYVRGDGAQRSDVAQRNYLRRVDKNRAKNNQKNNRKRISGAEVRAHCGKPVNVFAAAFAKPRKFKWPSRRKKPTGPGRKERGLRKMRERA